MRNDQIFKTTDYDKFKKIKGNRPIYKNHVEQLITSISQKNMLSEHPIVVSENFEVIDGQHRLQAAKKRSLEIYYIISNSQNTNGILEDVQRIQRAKPWSNTDYLESFIQLGKQEYVLLKEFMQTYDLPINTSCLLTSVYRRRSEIMNSFKHGMLQLNNYENGKIMGQRLLELKPYVEDGVRRDREFIYALYKVYEKVKHPELLRKLKQYKSKIESQRDSRAYLRILEDIYNFGRQNRVRFF